jgi:preprotein translocase subunit SecG
MNALFYVTMTFFILVCLMLIGLILIQKGRGGGLASAFGGAGGQTAFGSKTGDVLTWATSVVFAIFVVLAVTLNLEANHIDNTRHGTVIVPVANTPPAVPATPTSSLPTAPMAPPGIASPPPVNPNAAANLPANQSISPPTIPQAILPTTMPALIQHVVNGINAATSTPTTLP